MDWILKNTKQIHTIQIQSQKKFDLSTMYKYEFKQFSLKIVVFIIAFVNYFIID